jgi:hypothetical protein
MEADWIWIDFVFAYVVVLDGLNIRSLRTGRGLNSRGRERLWRCSGGAVLTKGAKQRPARGAAV